MNKLIIAILALTFFIGQGFAFERPSNSESHWDSKFSKQGWKKTGKYYQCHGHNGATNESAYLAVYEVYTPSNKIGFYSYADTSRYYVDESVFDPDMAGSIRQQGESLILEDRRSATYVSITRTAGTFLMPQQNNRGSQYTVYYSCRGYGVSKPGPF